jgi:hypothetical protein
MTVQQVSEKHLRSRYMDRAIDKLCLVLNFRFLLELHVYEMTYDSTPSDSRP